MTKEENIYKSIFEYPTKKIVELELKNEQLERENQQLKKQKDDVVEAIKGILEINNNYSIEKLAPFYSRKWVKDTQSNLLRMLGEKDE